MRVWRIFPARYAEKSFSGEGAVKHSARWHTKGTPVIYTAESLSLAALEFFVNLRIEEAETALVAASAEISESVRIVSRAIEELPADWREYPVPASTQLVGSQWLAAGQSAVLSVPSVLIPTERNYLLNPIHPEFRRIVIHKPEPFTFDPRMWKAAR